MDLLERKKKIVLFSFVDSGEKVYYVLYIMILQRADLKRIHLEKYSSFC